MKQKLVDFLNIFQALNKSLTMFLVLLVGIVFRVRGYLDGNNFVDLLRATVVSYFGVTGIAHFTSMVQQHLVSKDAAAAAAASDPDAIPVQIDPSTEANSAKVS